MERVSEKQKQRERGFYNGRRDLVRTEESERDNGRKGERWRERDLDADALPTMIPLTQREFFSLSFYLSITNHHSQI